MTALFLLRTSPCLLLCVVQKQFKKILFQKVFFLGQKLSSSWGPFKLLIWSRKSTHRTRQQMQLGVMCCSLHRAFQEEESIGLSSATQGLNVVICKTPTGAQKKAIEAILVLSEGFVALKGCGDVFWHLGPCMVLLRALRGHSLHHTLPSKTKTYLSQANTLPALKEISSWYNTSGGLCGVTFVTFLL